MAARQWTDEQRKVKLKNQNLSTVVTISRAITEEGKKEVFSKCAKDWRVHSRKVAEKRKAANKKLYGAFCCYGDKRYSLNRSFKYLGFLEPLHLLKVYRHQVGFIG